MKNLKILSSCFLTLSLFASCEKKEEKIPPVLLDRTGAISLSSEWINTKKAIEGLQLLVKKEPNNMKARLNLALAYMQEARITGEHPHYYPAAMELLEEVIDNSENNKDIYYQALVSKASVQLSLHQFDKALDTGKKALAINPNNSLVYGVLCDANVELGNYPEAVKMADKMVGMRPDLRSYSRVSYLREIHGDMKGSIEVMDMAVKAGMPGLEQTAWTRFTLGGLYEKVGDLSSAEFQYKSALAERPHYAFAMGGLAKLEAKRKNYEKAIAQYEKAGEVIPEFSFHEEIAKIYKATGKKEKAKYKAEEVIEMLKEDSDAGHFVDLELANLYVELLEDNDKALEHAMIEFKKRPENIDVNASLAHIYYKKGDLVKAKEHLTKANRTNKQDPALLCLSGLIYYKSGDKVAGESLIQKSFQADPFQSGGISEEARKIMPKLAIAPVVEAK